MNLRYIPFFIAILFLNACAGVSGHHIPDEYIALPEEAAFLVGSIGVKTAGENESPNSFSRIDFRQRGDEKKATLVISQSLYFPSDMDYKEADREGTVFSLVLEPGEYEIVNVSFFYNNGYVEKSYSAKEDFSVPFSIEAGRVYYMGEFLAFGKYGKNIFGITIAAGGYFVHYTNYERDLPLLLTKYPELQDREIVQLDLEVNVPPLIYSSK